MSLRASASLPSSCSGAMYWNVPRIVPRSVSGWLACISVAQDATRPRSGRAPAIAGTSPGRSPAASRPPSSASRCRASGPGARSPAGAPCRARRRSRSRSAAAARSAAAPSPSRSASVSPSRYSMTRYSVVALAADVVERADVRDARTARSSSPRARSAGGSRRSTERCGGSTLIATVALEPRVPRLVDLAHPARADRRQDLVGAEPRPGRERHRGSLPEPRRPVQDDRRRATSRRGRAARR